MPGSARTQGGSGPTRLVALLGAALASWPQPAAGLPPWEPAATDLESEPAPASEVPGGPPAANVAPAEIEAPANVPTATNASAPRLSSDDLPPVPADPNDAPFMRPPNNQLATSPPRTRPDIRRGWSSRRRVALTLAPAYASLRLPFLNRPANSRIHGAGVNLELDAQIYRWIWVRALGVYSGHPVGEERAQQENVVFRTAPPGTIHVMGFGAGPVFALDLGRFLPLIELGVAGLRVVTPHGGIKGHRGEACLDDGSCDVGLQCNSARICEVSTLGEMYLGGAVDVLVRRHFSFGAQFRYNVRFVELRALKLAPGYVLGTLRLTVRF